MSPSTTLNLDPGLYFDEAVRTLAEVTLEISGWAETAGWECDEEARGILDRIEQDPRSGLYRFSDQDHEQDTPNDLYQELAEYLTDHLENGRWFGYLNEGSGWGVWDYGEED